MQNRTNMPCVELYSDGSCLSNPGPGGWACILKYGEHIKEFYGAERGTTNNRMELTGVIEGFKRLKCPCIVTVITDSQYVVNAFNKGWIQNWVKNNFKDRLNADLWKELLRVMNDHQVTYQWIRGHNGHAYNERCDRLAHGAASKL